MDAGGSEDLPEQLARAVHDARLAAETRIAGHETDHLEDPDDLLEVTDHAVHRRDRVQRADPRGRLCVVRRNQARPDADLAGGDQLALDARQLTRDVDVVTRPDGGNVGRDRRDDGW
jgi:hypothetical protein